MSTPRQTSAKVHAAGRAAVDISDRLYVAINNARLVASDPKSRPGRSDAEDAGIRSKGGHSDPTADAALATIGLDERVFELMEANVATLELAVANLTQFCERWEDRKPVDHPLCNAGRDSVEEWARPGCEELAGYTTRNDGSISLRSDGLCDACRMRKSRHEARRRDAA